MGDYAERDPWTGRMEGRNMTPNELMRMGEARAKERIEAAAPELLEALEEILANAELSPDLFAREVLRSPLARTAIAKAKGTP